MWSRWDSNPLPFDCEPNALPDELLPLCYEKRVVLSDPTLLSISKLNRIHILICIESFTLYYLFYMIIIHHFRQKPFLKVLLHNCNAKIRKLFELHTFYFQTLCNVFWDSCYKSAVYTCNLLSKKSLKSSILFPALPAKSRCWKSFCLSWRLVSATFLSRAFFNSFGVLMPHLFTRKS